MSTTNVDHPKHYNIGTIEVIDIIEDWGLGFHLGNVIKYAMRAPYKGETLEDIDKALWYLQRYRDMIERNIRTNDLQKHDSIRLRDDGTE